MNSISNFLKRLIKKLYLNSIKWLKVNKINKFKILLVQLLLINVLQSFKENGPIINLENKYNLEFKIKIKLL